MSSLIKLSKAFEDFRGKIQPIVEEEVHDVAIITSNAGSIRANHFHKTDSHYSFVLSGKIKYLARPVGTDIPPNVEIFTFGDLFYTPSNVEHLMFFVEDTVFINISKKNRDHQHYEEDVVRVNLETYV